MTTTQGLMNQLLLALLPAAVVMIWWFGFGIVLNIVIAGVAAILCEFVVLRIQGKPLNTLLDGSAIVTAALLALALPPMLPGWDDYPRHWLRHIAGETCLWRPWT